MNADLSTTPELCRKELAAGFERGDFKGIRAGAVITEYIGEVESFRRARFIRRHHPESARWFIKMEGMSRCLNGCPVNLAEMASQSGLASIANHAEKEEANAEICVRTDLVSPVTGQSPVVFLVAKTYIPASKPGTDGGPAKYVKIRWTYPGKALECDHIPLPCDWTDEDEGDEEEEDKEEEDKDGEDSDSDAEMGGGGGGQRHTCAHTLTHTHARTLLG